MGTSFDDSGLLDKTRLLEFFPVSVLRAHWGESPKTKDEICLEVAEKRSSEDILAFVEDQSSCCKQHVFVFERPEALQTLPGEAGGVSVSMVSSEGKALFLPMVRYGIILRDPLEEVTLEYLWPFRLEITEHHFLLRFVTMERNFNSIFERQHYVSTRNLDQEMVVQELTKGLGLTPADLHKGMKQLWAEGYMDSSKAKYKKPISLASEAMDEQRGIREHNPELYELLQELPLLQTLFTIAPEQDSTVTAVSIDPSKGYLVFPRYSELKGDTDAVIHRLLGQNQ